MRIKLIKFMDKYFGVMAVILLKFLSLFSRKKPEKDIKKILIIMFWGIGSNIVVLPSIKALKKKFPKAEIDVLAPEKNMDLFYGNKNIKNKIFVGLGLFSLIKTIKKVNKKYDLVFDFEHWLNISAIISFFAAPRRIGFANKARALLYTDKIRFNNKKHAVENNLDLIRIFDKNAKAEIERLKYSNEDNKFVLGYLKKNKIKNKDFVVGVCAGSGETVKERRWPKENFAALCEILIEKYKAKIILAGSKKEIDLLSEIKNHINNKKNAVIFNGTLGQLIALTDRCKLFISNDTGPMHIAAYQSIRTVGLFGPETPVIFGPYGSKAVSIFKNLECSPCIRIYTGSYRKCDDNKCMKAIKIDEVMKKIEEVLRK